MTAIMTGWWVYFAVICVGGLGVAAWLRWTDRHAGWQPEPVGDDTVALACKPCHGEPGPGHCTCVRKCAHPLCGAPDTVLGLFTPADGAWLSGAGIELEGEPR